ncbi:MAG: hypothetical protein LAT64_07945 [Phycisphaerales bacterium]|nr:hypothetical protein [Planctomycetota bacterium]MCH8508686.1 hypothetical protein [Phycisphaerales bacterium]
MTNVLAIRCTPGELRNLDEIAEMYPNGGTSRAACAKAFLPIDVDMRQAVQQAYRWLTAMDALATKGRRIEVKSPDEAFRSVFATGLRCIMHRQGVSELQVDLSDNEIIDHLWPAFVEAFHNEHRAWARDPHPHAPRLVDGRDKGLPGLWVVTGDEALGLQGHKWASGA